MNYDPIPCAERAAYFTARGVRPNPGFMAEIRMLETTAHQTRAYVDPARAAFFGAKRASSPVKPVNRYASRDARDRARLEAKRKSPVFVTDDMIRRWEAIK